MPGLNIGPGELILILVIALIVFGPGKLPEIGQAVGKGIREFRKAATDVTEATRLDTPPASSAATTPPAPPPAVPPTAAAPSAPAADAAEPTDGDTAQPSA